MEPLDTFFIYFFAITTGQGRDIQVHGFVLSNGCIEPFGHKKLILLQAFELSPLNTNKTIRVTFYL